MADTTDETTPPTLTERIQFAVVTGFLRLLRPLGPDRASALGGRLLRTIGPLSREHRVARRNLTAAFPEKSPADIRQILSGMWDNFGRSAFELGFISEFNITKPGGRVAVIGKDIADRAIAGQATPIFVSAHWGSWEVVIQIPRFTDDEMVLIYKTLKNPLLDAWLLKERQMPTASFAPKGEAGLKQLSVAVRNKKPIGLMIDQKIRQGIEVPFFGRPAMTPDFPAKAAVRLGGTLIPVNVVRTGGAHFEMTIYEPLEFEPTGNTDRDIDTVVRLYTQFVEDRIREHPEQWFWMHNRWGPSKRQKLRQQRKLERKRLRQQQKSVS